MSLAGAAADFFSRGMAELMRRLGYTRYVAQGGDQGAAVTDAMGRQAPEGLIGIHMNLLVPALLAPQPAESEEERVAADVVATFSTNGFGYFLEQATRPQTIGYALLDSPVGWPPGCSTTTRTAITRSLGLSWMVSQPAISPRDHILDNVTLYWLTGTGTSSGPVVLGKRTGRRPYPGSPTGQAPGRLHDVPR